MLVGLARRVAGVLILGAAALALPACSPQVSGPALVLRLASPYGSTDDTALPIRHFADEVDRRSEGTIRIDPVWNAADGYVHHWDQLTARTVVAGTYQLGLVPGRAFDLLGVDTLRALNTPFLITNQAALETVLDSELRDELLAGLPDAGLVGLDIFPDGLRHPFGYDRPLVGAEDYDGALIRAGASGTVARLFGALGAHVRDVEPPTSKGGAEAQFSLAPVGAGYATGNVTFFPRTNVLVANSAVPAHLRPDQWGVLRDAAAATRDWQFSRQRSDFEAAARFCGRGGVIVAASADQVASLQPAAAAVTTWLRRDAATSRLIDAITRATDGAPAATITECPGKAGPTPSGGADTVSALDGRYRARVTRRDLVRAGVTNENIINENTGRFTWILDSGTYTSHQKAAHYLANPDVSGRFTYEDGVLTIYWDESGDWSRVSVRVSRQGTIRFSDEREGISSNRALGQGFFSNPWVRVGDVPR